MIKILVADDHSIVRRGIKDILNEMSTPVQVDEASSVQGALKAIRNETYDILLLDMAFPDGSGLDILGQARVISPSTRVLFLSMYPEKQYARRVLKAGAYGYLTKDSAPIELTNAIQKVREGGKYVTLSLAEQMVADLTAPENDALHERLSSREYQVMLALGRGQTISGIASELSLSPKTVSTYRGRILEKLKLTTTAELIRYVVEKNL